MFEKRAEEGEQRELLRNSYENVTRYSQYMHEIVCFPSLRYNNKSILVFKATDWNPIWIYVQEAKYFNFEVHSIWNCPGTLVDCAVRRRTLYRPWDVAVEGIPHVQGCGGASMPFLGNQNHGFSIQFYLHNYFILQSLVLFQSGWIQRAFQTVLEPVLQPSL